MARVTVEDCVDKVPNRFDLVMLAAHRSRSISAGAPLTIDRDNDRNPVVALREIADETISLDETRDALIRGLQRHVEVDEPEEEDTLELMAGAIMAGENGEFGQGPAGQTAVAVAAPVTPGESTAAEGGENPKDAAEGGENPKDAAAVQEADGQVGTDSEVGAYGPEKSE